MDEQQRLLFILSAIAAGENAFETALMVPAHMRV